MLNFLTYRVSKPCPHGGSPGPVLTEGLQALSLPKISRSCLQWRVSCISPHQGSPGTLSTKTRQALCQLRVSPHLDIPGSDSTKGLWDMYPQGPLGPVIPGKLQALSPQKFPRPCPHQGSATFVSY